MKRASRWVGIGIGSLVLLLGATLGVMYGISVSREGDTYSVAAPPLELPTDEASLAEGERLYVARGCGDCHRADGTGRVVMDGPPARIVATNLTVSTAGWSVADHARAIRHGVDPDGQPLIMMPSHEYWGMSDRDLSRIIAHYTRLPRTGEEAEPSEIRFLGRILHTAGLFPMFPAELIDHGATRPAPMEPAETAEYGEYLAVGCTGCHGETFSGGPIPGAPPELGVPANLTPHETGLASWSREDFVTALREGRRPDGTELNPSQMPFEAFGRMTDVELHALWLFFSSIEPRPEGNR